jgi:hypothetical protein
MQLSVAPSALGFHGGQRASAIRIRTPNPDMFKSIILPVGSSDIDGPDFIVIPWKDSTPALFRKRVQASMRLFKADDQLTCLRFLAKDAMGFFTPAEDGKWLEKLDTMHVENTLLATRETPSFFLKRWKAFKIPMPDPPRFSVYPDGGIFLSGPIGLSSTRWETSCGLRLGKNGQPESVPKVG